MDKAAKARLKQFIEDNIPFYELKKVGFFSKDIRKTDYEKIAARVCRFFGLKTIHEYEKIGADIDLGCPTNWPTMPLVEQHELISKDKYLN